MLSWYEATLPARERKARGHFSTPPPLVEQVLDACGYTLANDLSQIRVLDPACGSGNFLAGCLRRLIAFGQCADHETLISSVQRNIWGLDLDPVACFLAEMQLRTILTENAPCIATLPLHIHQADGLALPWDAYEKQSKQVDLFLANPPYLAAKNNDLSGYRDVQGQTDSYLLFLRLALQIVRPDGWLGLILPDPVLARSNASSERQRLLKEMTVHQLWHLADVFAAHVGAVVIIAQKKLPSHSHQISWVRKKWDALDSPKSVPQALLRRQAGSELRYLLSDVQGSLLEQLHLCREHSGSFVPLSELVTIRRGEELSKESPLLAASRPVDGQAWYPVLRGGVDVQAYTISEGQRWIAGDRLVKPLANYLIPKLLVVKSTGYLRAALDLNRHVVLQTLYLLRLRGPGASQARVELTVTQLDELYFLLALLNSRLLQEYVYIMHSAYKWVQPQIEQHVLAELPIPVIASKEKAEIIKRARLLMHACSPVPPVVELKIKSELYQEQERSIRRLYEDALFPGRVGPV